MSENKELAVVYESDGQEIRLTPSIVQNYIVGNNANITMPEFKFFTELCKVRKLNPFLNEAYCVKYSDTTPAQILVSKEAIYKRANRNPEFDGIESGVIIQEKETGHIIERQGTFFLKAEENLVGGWAKVYRKDRKYPTYCSVSFDEVSQKKKDGSLNTNWAGKGATMVEKVAKVRALRETFVEDLGGMLEADECGLNIGNNNQNDYNDIQNIPIIEQDEPVEVVADEVNLSDL